MKNDATQVATRMIASTVSAEGNFGRRLPGSSVADSWAAVPVELVDAGGDEERRDPGGDEDDRQHGQCGGELRAPAPGFLGRRLLGRGPGRARRRRRG